MRLSQRVKEAVDFMKEGNSKQVWQSRKKSYDTGN